MAELNSQAQELNRILKAHNGAIYDLLSKKGKAIYFPAKGILAQGAAAKGKEINATVGTAYEDDGKPMVMPSLSGLYELESTDVFPYAPSEGIKPLREKWQELIRAKNPSLGNCEISLPVVTCGVTNGLSMVGYMFADEGDEIVLSDLYWENYDLVFANACGAKLKLFTLFKDKGFDIASFKEAIMSGPAGKRIVLLNFPNNPSGYTPTDAEVEQITNALTEAAAAGNRLVVVCDDSYFGLVFDDSATRESLFARLACAHENLLAIKADGITKEEYAWGLRVGFVTYGVKNGNRDIYKALEGKTAGALRGNISNAPHSSQSAFLKALNSEAHEQEKERNRAGIRERYLKVKETLAAHPEYSAYFQAYPFNSGYFMCVKLKGLDPDKVWQTLLDNYSTGVICYSDIAVLRLAFASTPAGLIEKLFANIYAACKDCV